MLGNMSTDDMQGGFRGLGFRVVGSRDSMLGIWDVRVWIS